MVRNILIALLLAGLAGVGGYDHGKNVTSARYEARMAQAQAARAAEDQARAEAVARAERKAREALTTEVERGNALAVQLAEQKNQLVRERAAINRRIKDASERALADCRGLSAEWVGLYNDALGLSAGAAGAPGVCSRAAGSSSASSGTAADARVARSADAGIRPNSLNTALATPEDVLAHARDYGGWCRALAAQNNALIEWGKP